MAGWSRLLWFTPMRWDTFTFAPPLVGNLVPTQPGWGQIDEVLGNKEGLPVSNGAPSPEELLGLYHDLWDLRARAISLNRSFLAYMLEVAMEEINQDLSRHPAHQQGIPPRQGSGR